MKSNEWENWVSPLDLKLFMKDSAQWNCDKYFKTLLVILYVKTYSNIHFYVRNVDTQWNSSCWFSSIMWLPFIYTPLICLESIAHIVVGSQISGLKISESLLENITDITLTSKLPWCDKKVTSYENRTRTIINLAGYHWKDSSRLARIYHNHI